MVIHLGVMFNDHAGDSIYLIDRDEGIRSLSNLPTRLMEPSWPGPAGVEMGAWRPAHTALIALTWSVAGRSPQAFHIVKLLLHATVIILVVYVLFALFPPLAATVGGLIFAIHPVHVEVVMEVAGMSEMLAAIFGLSAALLHLKAPKGYGLGRALGVTVLYVFAVLSKESGAVLPLLLFLLDAARTDMTARRTLAYVRSHGPLYALMAAALALVLIVRLSVLGAVTRTPTPYGMEVLADIPRVWTVMQAWPHYVRLLLFPLDLSIDNTPGIIPVAFGFTPLAITGAFVALVAFSVALWSWRSGEPLDPNRSSERVIGFGVLWIAAALLPVSNILFVSPVLVAERNLYLPSLGLVAIVGWVVSRVEAKRVHTGAAIVAVMIVAGAARTVTRIPDWRDNDTLWAELLESHPESGSGWVAFAERLFEDGRGREGLRAYAVAIDLLGLPQGQAVVLSSHLIDMNRPESARFFLRRAWRQRPDSYRAPALLSDVTRRLGNFEEAGAAARAATVLAPSNPSNHHLLGQAYTALGRHSEAIDARAVALHKGFPNVSLEWIYISLDYTALADTSAAVAALDSASVHAVTDQVRIAVAAGREALTASR